MNFNFQYLLFICYALFVTFGSCSSQNPASDSISIEDTLPFQLSSEAKNKLKFKSGVRSILEDGQGNIWFGSHSEGVCKYDGKQFTYYTTEDGLSNNQVRSIFKDKSGKIWFECGEGISSYDGEKMFTHNYKDYSSVNTWKSSYGDLWFKGDRSTGYNVTESSPGVYRWDGLRLSYHFFPLKVGGASFNQFSVSTPFAEGKGGRLWFGTYSAVFGYDASSFVTIDDKSLGLNELSGFLHVRSLFEDSKGRLWIGNNGIGVLLKEGEEIYNFSDAKKLISVTSGRNGGHRSAPGTLEHVFTIGEDKEGNIWFGDRDTGAWRYDGKTIKNYDVEDGLSTTHIWQIYETSKGALWFAMADGSVCEFRGDSFVRVF